MCALVCDIPKMPGQNNVPVVDCGDFCQPHCDPCAPASFPPCPPPGECRCDCGDYNGCCYQQPPRTLPIRPVGCMMRSTAPMEKNTIYRCSYLGNCGDNFRSKPVFPCNNIQSTNAPLETCTIQKLSYLPNCCVQRTPAIRPRDSGLKFCGPMYAMTSQKHDYVPKGHCRRQPIKPMHGISKDCGPIECCTINRLSYMPVDICQNPPPKPILQGMTFQRPTGPGEKCTIQKLSYLPICIPPKDPMPWANKSRICPPKYEQLCTTYNLSYLPNCNPGKTAPIMPAHSLRFFGSDRNDGNTVYKLSYIGNDARCSRPPPILPINGLEMPKGPMEKCTVHKLSYLPNCCAPRTLPIRPREQVVKTKTPVYFMTTQKHDFVPKPISRRNPIRPVSMICRPTTGLERCTINKLSYLPVDVCQHPRAQPIRPNPGVLRENGPVEKCTTYKLSYLPNCMPPKEPLPWANASQYVRPTAPIEKCTIQRLSYGPPGSFAKCCICVPNKQDTSANYPKAGIC